MSFIDNTTTGLYNKRSKRPLEAEMFRRFKLFLSESDCALRPFLRARCVSSGISFLYLSDFWCLFMQIQENDLGTELLPIDLSRLDMVADNDAEKASLLDFFFSITVDILSEMKAALEAQATTQWKDAAHKLRGAAGNVGMVPLAKLCLACETGSELSTEMLVKIEDEIRRIKSFIAQKAPALLASGT